MYFEFSEIYALKEEKGKKDNCQKKIKRKKRKKMGRYGPWHTL